VISRVGFLADALQRNRMSKRATEHYRKASEHLARAAQHDEKAAQNHEAGRDEAALQHAQAARTHTVRAESHADKALQAYVEHVHLLMGEVRHRARNTLNLVQAIARQTATGAPETFITRFSERIRALASNQDLLVQNHREGVELEHLVSAQLTHLMGQVGSQIPPTAQQGCVLMRPLLRSSGLRFTNSPPTPSNTARFPRLPAMSTFGGRSVKAPSRWRGSKARDRL
jgi:HWE histidine kinase